MPFVVDASVTAVWAFDNEDHPHADDWEPDEAAIFA